MSIMAMLSAKDSPGVTTTALACTLTWSGRTVLAECDPAGGDVLAGYLSGLEIIPRGLLPLAMAELRDQAHREFPNQLVDLDARRPGHRLLLPGITDPVQAGTLRPTWARLTSFFADLERAEPGYDVIADCGRLTTSTPPWPLLHRADLVLLVARRSSLRTISPVMPAAALLRRELTEHGSGPGSLALLLVGDGPYHRREIEQRLHVPVLAELPDDRRTADVLSDGGRLRGSRDLLRAAASAEPTLRRAVELRRANLTTATPKPARETSRAY